jgi:hypothetical protein
MTMTTSLARWPHLMDQLCAQFQHLDLAVLTRFRGDPQKITRYLAQTHDLTVVEAAETLDDWLMFQLNDYRLTPVGSLFECNSRY